MGYRTKKHAPDLTDKGAPWRPFKNAETLSFFFTDLDAKTQRQTLNMENTSPATVTVLRLGCLFERTRRC
jgi:hypothetical protein